MSHNIKFYGKATLSEKYLIRYYDGIVHVLPPIRGESSKKNKQQQTPPVEAPNSLISNTRIKILDLICEGPIAGFAPKSGTNNPLASVYFDEVPLINSDGSSNYNVSGQGFSFGYTTGTATQTAITNFEKTESYIALPSNTRIASPPAGAGDTKTLTASFNTSQYPDADSVKVVMRVPALLTQDEKGNTNPYEITYAIDISLNNGQFVTMGNYSIRGKCTAPYFRSHVLTLPRTTPASTDYSWKIRVRRTSTNIISIKTQNELFVDSISVKGSNSYRYPNSVLAGIELSAEQFSSIPSRAYEIKGLLVKVPSNYTPTVYNSDGTVTAAVYTGNWNGTFAASKQWTDNPAWIYYDILTNPRYGLGDLFKEYQIDKWTLYQIAQYCDELISDGKGGTEPRFTCNISIQNRTDAFDLIMNLASVFRGISYWSNGRIFPVQDVPKNPVYNFTNANVKDGNFTYSDTARNVRSTVAVVKWVDPQNLYRETIEYVEDTDGILKYGYIEKEVTAFACTSRGQAYRVGRWIIETEKSLTETITFQVGLDGLYVRPGDVFNVYDNFRNNRSQGGRTVFYDAGGSGVGLDRDIIIEPNVSYQLSVVVPALNLEASGEVTSSTQISLIRNSQIETRAVSTSPGTGSYLTVSSGFSTGLSLSGVPWILNGIYTGTSGIFYGATPYKCLAIAEVEKGIIEVLGLEYSSGYYAAIETGYTTVANSTNDLDTSPISPPSSLLVTGVTGMLSDNRFFFYIRSTWVDSPSSNLSYYRISGQVTGGPINFLSNVFNTGYNFNTTYTGQHLFWVGAVSNGGVESSFITGGFFVPTGNPLGGPPNLSGVVIAENYDPLIPTTGYIGTSPIFSWDFPTGENGLYIPEINFLSSYTIRFQDLVTNQGLYSDTAGVDDLAYGLTRDKIYGFTGGAKRAFKIAVITNDVFGNSLTGATLNVDNRVPYPAVSSSFFVSAGGMNYNIQANANDSDISGVYIWYNTGSLDPKINVPNYTSKNLAGFAPTIPDGLSSVYFTLIDTFGYTGSIAVTGSIQGPISVATNIGVTGIKITGNAAYLTNGVSLSGNSYMQYAYEGQHILLKPRYPTLINFFIYEPISGDRISEAIIARNMVLTGYCVSLSGVNNSHLSGRFYHIGMDNSNKSFFQDFGIPVSQSSQTGSLLTGIGAYRKIGFDMTFFNVTGIGRLSLALFGFEDS